VQEGKDKCEEEEEGVDHEQEARKQDEEEEDVFRANAMRMGRRRKRRRRGCTQRQAPSWGTTFSGFSGSGTTKKKSGLSGSEPQKIPQIGGGLTPRDPHVSVQQGPRGEPVKKHGDCALQRCQLLIKNFTQL
jgi:hypothetical protein